MCEGRSHWYRWKTWGWRTFCVQCHCCDMLTEWTRAGSSDREVATMRTKQSSKINDLGHAVSDCSKTAGKLKNMGRGSVWHEWYKKRCYRHRESRIRLVIKWHHLPMDGRGMDLPCNGSKHGCSTLAVSQDRSLIHDI